LVGLSLVAQPVRRHGFVRSRTLHLHETGRPAYDRITVEHNGLLARQGLEAAVLQATLAQLHATPGWDELSLSGVPAADFAHWQQAAAALGLRPQLHWLKPYFFVDLAQVRAQHPDYLKPSAPTPATSCGARCGCRPSRAAALRTGRVRAPGTGLAGRADGPAPGPMAGQGRAGRLRQRVHAALPPAAGTASAPERVWLTRLSAGKKLLGYLYNFQRDGMVYNYQAGHIHESDAKLKPGLVCLRWPSSTRSTPARRSTTS
jgi:hypothetical protein